LLVLGCFLGFEPFSAPKPQQRQSRRQDEGGGDYEDVCAAELAYAKEGGDSVGERGYGGDYGQVENDDC
jgi:hypothetical protein